MTNLLEQAINCNDGDRAAKIIRDALGIESSDAARYCFPKEWPANREQRADIIGEWLHREASFIGGRTDGRPPLPGEDICASFAG